MGKIRTRAGIAALAILALAATSCASDKATSGGGSAAGSDGVKTGPGITDTTINVAQLLDLTGPFSAFGKSQIQAQQLYFDKVNAAGGVCGRKYQMTVRDHGYDVQKAVAAYTEVAPRTAAITQFVGSPLVAAVKQRIDQDKIFTIPLAWATTLLGSRPIQVFDTTYDIDMINGVEFLAKEEGLKAGDKIGMVYFEGDFGQSSLNGVKYAAGKLGMQVVEQKIKATDEDMSAQVEAFKSAGVNAIVIAAGPRQAASLAGVARAKGMDVPIVGTNSVFVPQLLDTPAAPALQKDFYVIAAQTTLSSPLPAVKNVLAEYKAKYPNAPIDGAVLTAWRTASIVDAAMKKACQNKDMTREGIIAAHRSESNFGAEFGTPNDFTSPDRPATRASFVLKPDKSQLGGLAIFKDAAVSDLAKNYQVPVG